MNWKKHVHTHKYPFIIAAGIVVLIVILAHWMSPSERRSSSSALPTPAPVSELSDDTTVVAPK